MAKHPRDWDEDYVLSLPLEDDTLERKGTKKLDLTVAGVDENEVLAELAKQLSAFANTGGGRLIYGLTNKGEVDDGGVTQTMKGRTSTKEWLEDVIPKLTEYEIVGVNVYVVRKAENNPLTASDKALFVVDIPDSERAPHQSKRDLRYYVRLASKSQPAPHLLIEDIRNRRKHPVVGTALELLEATHTASHVSLAMRITLRNEGRIMATHMCLFLEAPLVRAKLHISSSEDSANVAAQREGTGPNNKFFELRNPLYPEMETSFRVTLNIGATAKSLSGIESNRYKVPGTFDDINEATVRWRAFADSAIPLTGEITLDELGLYDRVAVR